MKCSHCGGYIIVIGPTFDESAEVKCLHCGRHDYKAEEAINMKFIKSYMASRRDRKASTLYLTMRSSYRRSGL